VADGEPVTDRDLTGPAKRATQRGQRRPAGQLHEESRTEVGGQPPWLQVLLSEIVEGGGESIVPTELIQLGAVV
jgi:hypothetical protein